MAPKRRLASRTCSGGTAAKARKARSPMRHLISLLFSRSPKQVPLASAHDASDGLDGLAAELDAEVRSKMH